MANLQSLNLTRPIVFADLESTGKDPLSDRIVSFGVAVLNPDGTRGAKWYQMFNPGIPIPPESTAIHGITDEMVKDCPPFSEHARRIAIALHGKDFGGFNFSRFDLVLLDEELRRSSYMIDMAGVRVIDVYGIFSKKNPRKLADCCRRYLGREPRQEHHAEADAEDSLDSFVGQLAAHDDIGETIDQVADFSRLTERPTVDLGGKLYLDADGDLCYGFGAKHPNQKVRRFPDYGIWMLDKGRFPGSTLDAVYAELVRVGYIEPRKASGAA